MRTNGLEFFRHDVNAQQDLKIRRIIRDHGYEGYGVYWHIVEILYMSNGSAPYADIKAEVSGIASVSILDSLIDSGLLHMTDDNMLVSDRVVREFSFAEERRQRYSDMGKTSAARRTTEGQPKLNESSTEVEPTLKTTKRFTKPTIEEIAAYCKERNNGMDAEHFFSYYETRNWIPSGSRTQMKDWKAAVRTWERNSTGRKGESKVCNNAERMKADMNENGGFDL